MGNKGTVRTRATLANSALDSEKPVGIEMQPVTLTFGSLSADTLQKPVVFL